MNLHSLSIVRFRICHFLSDRGNTIAEVKNRKQKTLICVGKDEAKNIKKKM